jgi:hypothetical protein
MILIHPSLVEIDEAELVERVLSNPLRRDFLLNIKGIEAHSIALTCVPMTGLPGSPEGDVDILLVPPGRPDRATAIEVKRIKVGASALRSRRPNRLREFTTKAVRQANRLARIGFSQTYLWPLVVVDSREQNAGRNTYDGMPASMHSAVMDALTVNGLDPRVGLIHYNFVQPMDYSPLTVGAGGTHLVKLAEEVAQSADVTTWVAHLAASRRDERTDQ